jgi:hypothetical protein
MARYMLWHKPDTYYDRTNPPPAEFMAKMGGLMADMTAAGVMLAGEGLKHPQFRTKLEYKNGQRTATDGPYAEAKEVIGGFVIVDVKSKEEAIEWADRFAACFDEIEVEVSPLTEASDFQ